MCTTQWHYHTILTTWVWIILHHRYILQTNMATVAGNLLHCRSWKQWCIATIIFIFLLLTTITTAILYTFQHIDPHQFTPWNTEEQQSWGSFVWDKLETIYETSIAVVYVNAYDCSDCLQKDYQALITPRNICRAGNEPDILLLIFASGGDWLARQALRKTWLAAEQTEQTDVQHVFLVGQDGDQTVQDELVKESLKFGDILQYRYKDTYRNMTIKTITGLRWASKNCAKAGYVIKLDSDLWLNIPKWRRLMFGPNRHKFQNVVFGHCRRYPVVNRTPFHRYGTSMKAFSKSHHPSYCRGGSYAMSMKLAKEIAEVSYKVGYIPVEDAYIGHCVKALGYKVYNPLGFKMDELADLWDKIKQYPCYLKEELYVIISVNPTQLRTLDDLASMC